MSGKELKKYSKLPEGLTLDMVLETAKENMCGLNNEGYCLACGELADSVEPDASYYECDSCGEKAVFGAEEILLRFAL